MKPLTIAAGLVFAGAVVIHAATPVLRSGVYVSDGGSPLSVSVMSAPTVADWNNDGKKDLVVGHFTYGKISLFLNQNTDDEPVFNGGSYIQSGGADITTSYG